MSFAHAAYAPYPGHAYPGLAGRHPGYGYGYDSASFEHMKTVREAEEKAYKAHLEAEKKAYDEAMEAEKKHYEEEKKRHDEYMAAEEKAAQEAHAAHQEMIKKDNEMRAQHAELASSVQARRPHLALQHAAAYGYAGYPASPFGYAAAGYAPYGAGSRFAALPSSPAAYAGLHHGYGYSGYY